MAHENKLANKGCFPALILTRFESGLSQMKMPVIKGIEKRKRKMNISNYILKEINLFSSKSLKFVFNIISNKVLKLELHPFLTGISLIVQQNRTILTVTK